MLDRLVGMETEYALRFQPQTAFALPLGGDPQITYEFAPQNTLPMAVT